MNSTVVIHLSKIDHNLRVIQKRLKHGVKTMAVVKDNAYGHGLEGIATYLKDRVDWFCVARVSEGIKLRELGIKNQILVFEAPQIETKSIYLKYNLTATLTGIDVLNMLEPGTKYHINLDTGMHRLGVIPEDVNALLNEISKYPDITCTGIYTHFYKADDPSYPEVKMQLDLFRNLRAQFPSELLTHVANTGGIFHYEDLDPQFDAVRPGVCLYGYSAGETMIPELEPILDWKSSIMQVKSVKKGDTVSYGGKWVAPKDGFIGIVPLGYSDGLTRRLYNSIQVLIDGKFYQQIGVISMDYCMIDLQQNKLKQGSEVFFLKDKKLTAYTWAKIIETIPYEITTNIKERVKRIYI